MSEIITKFINPGDWRVFLVEYRPGGPFGIELARFATKAEAEAFRFLEAA